MKNDLILEIFKYIAVFFISIFLPKKLTYFTASFISYYFKCIIKYWYCFLIITIVILFLYYNNCTILFEKENINYKVIILTYLCLSLLTFIFSFTKFIFSSNSFFSLYPTYTIKDNEFIVNDIQSEKLNEIIKFKILSLKSKFFIFRTKIIDAQLIEIPLFFPIILGYGKYLKFIKYKLNLNNPISLYIQKDLLDSNLRTQLFLNKNLFINTAIFNEIDELNLEIAKSQNKTIDEKIGSILFLYFFIISQIFLDQTLDLKQFNDTLKILNDLEEQLIFIEDDLKSYSLKDEKINNFCIVWKGIIKRYYSIVYIEQKEYKKAIDFIIESDQINPYFPQSNYEKAKYQYINKYLLELIPQIENQKKIFQVELNNQETNEQIANIYEKLEYESSIPNHQILFEIINRNKEDKEIIKYIDQKLIEKLTDNKNIFSLLFVLEAYKILPLGDKKYNNIYVERIPKVIEILEKIITLDNEFEIIHLKIGILKFMYAHSFDKIEKVEEALEYMKSYLYLYKKYGLT